MMIFELRGYHFWPALVDSRALPSSNQLDFDLVGQQGRAGGIGHDEPVF